ncbi:MAG: sigma 54-interacting transcriptional regulator [Acidobacteriota bacterium]|nr:sigma 54-interacting transcriptional regulator [Acidobacteriota bacterium]
MQGTPGIPSRIVCASGSMRRVVDLARRAGGSVAKILITGESGVGKDLVAQEIHAASARRTRPFVAVNCAGFPESLLESELFGHVRGSFTGADRDRPGKLQLADSGTLFLDEVGEMSLRMQALLLRFLESGEIQTVGEQQSRIVNVRLIAATNRNLSDRVAAGEFREDLLYRLRVIEIAIQPLRERTDDIPALTDYFVSKAPKQITVSEAVRTALLRHRWPGNVRELQHVIEQAAWLADGTEIRVEDLPEALRTSVSSTVATRERRRRVADQLFEALVQGHYSFWDHVHPLFLERDLTRHDLRELVGRGLKQTRGNYRALLRLFRLPESDYHRFHNFLTAHSCKVDYRIYRTGADTTPSRPQGLSRAS